MTVFLKLCHTTVLPFVANCFVDAGRCKEGVSTLPDFFPPSIKCSFFLLYRHLLKNMVKHCIKKMRNIFWRWSCNGASVWSHGNKVLFMWPSPFAYILLFAFDLSVLHGHLVSSSLPDPTTSKDFHPRFDPLLFSSYPNYWERSSTCISFLMFSTKQGNLGNFTLKYDI